MRGLGESFEAKWSILLRRKAAVTWLDFRATKSRMSTAVHVSGLAASASAGVQEVVSADHSRTQVRSESDQQVRLAWLLKLRWGAVGGQLAVLAFVRVILDLDLPYLALVGLTTFTALTNAALLIFPSRPAKDWRLPAVLVTDSVVLTAMLALSGGVTNPFTVFFLVHVALASLLLEPRLAWTLVVLTVVAFASLFFLPAQHMLLHHHGGAFSAHLVGMWVAYALAAAFVAQFVGKMSRAIRERDRRLSAIAGLASQNERLATLSGFSANAAHELGSPLATIGLAAKELAIAIRRGQPKPSLEADADLVCREVARCREILADLSSRAGESVGEMPVHTTPRRVVEELARLMSPKLAPHFHATFADEAASSCDIVAPVRTLSQMLHNLIRNAFEAQEEAGVDVPVELRVVVGERLCLHVLDRGKGLPEHVRARFGEPFLTTKGDRGGLGLGIYLARAYAERTGGNLVFQDRAEGGSDVELCLTRNAVGSARR
jgi:two-component system sensor histidine kinase RegB